jgi:hypothetical protein
MVLHRGKWGFAEEFAIFLKKGVTKWQVCGLVGWSIRIDKNAVCGSSSAAARY